MFGREVFCLCHSRSIGPLFSQKRGIVKIQVNLAHGRILPLRNLHLIPGGSFFDVSLVCHAVLLAAALGAAAGRDSLARYQPKILSIFCFMVSAVKGLTI